MRREKKDEKERGMPRGIDESKANSSSLVISIQIDNRVIDQSVTRAMHML